MLRQKLSTYFSSRCTSTPTLRCPGNIIVQGIDTNIASQEKATLYSCPAKQEVQFQVQMDQTFGSSLSTSNIEENSIFQCPKGRLEIFFNFSLLYIFHCIWKLMRGYYERLNFFVETEKNFQIIVKAGTFGCFDKLLIHMLGYCQGKHFKSIKYILSAYS